MLPYSTLPEPASLVAVTPERIRRALRRSFLRYGITAELEAAVGAAMNVIGPVLEARDTEIKRLRRAPGVARTPGRATARHAGPATRRPSAFSR